MRLAHVAGALCLRRAPLWGPHCHITDAQAERNKNRLWTCMQTLAGLNTTLAKRIDLTSTAVQDGKRSRMANSVGAKVLNDR